VVKVWSLEEARFLPGAIDGNRLKALYSVALVVGLRQGEALGLKWDDVDVVGASLRVRQQLQRIDGVYRFTETRTERSGRTIALPEFAVAALRAHRVCQLQDRLFAGQDWQDDSWGLVLMSLRATPLDAKNVTHRFRDLLAKLVLPRMRFHDLRHACASLRLI
jgi:integrase